MKRMILVSTGRCGTTRVAQILRKHMPESFGIFHQIRLARLANIAGHMMYYSGGPEFLKRFLFGFITERYAAGRSYVTTDPLTAMIIPEEVVTSPDVCIMHVMREPESLGKSFFRLSRKRVKSFIGHNFVPFWQPGLWPLENLLNPRVVEKYGKVARLKAEFFDSHYSRNPNYIRVPMEDLFRTDILEKSVNAFFNAGIRIPASDLAEKANQTID
jgi:hypothetical protein